MLRRHWIVLAAAGLAALLILFAARNAAGADSKRGAALYEPSCGTCHSESVHGRPKRDAKNFDEVRGWVVRWKDNLGLRWGDEEIDDVSVYLNDSYYHFECPRNVCKVVS